MRCMYYKITKLEDGVYRLYSLEGVHSDLFAGSCGALLRDTGYGLGNLKEMIRKITYKPLTILNSHAHLDHASGNYQFDEEIGLNSKDWELYKKISAPEMRRGAVEAARHTPDCY